jgi:cyclic pyranopterin phosphate synthase
MEAVYADGLNELRSDGLKTIGMTTNGIVLKGKIHELRKRGLDQLNISLDTLDPQKFELLTRRRGKRVSYLISHLNV